MDFDTLSHPHTPAHNPTLSGGGSGPPPNPKLGAGEPHSRLAFGATNALSLSPDQKVIAVGGCDTLHLARLTKKHKLEAVANGDLRAGRAGAQYEGGYDVRFHRTDKNKIMTATTGGLVVQWDINELSSDIIFRANQGINRLCWSYAHPSVMLAACQDGNVYVLDTRQKTLVGMVKCRSAVRDVQYSKYFKGVHFAVGLENGSVLTYDTRKMNTPKSGVWQGHQDAAMSVDWHPIDSNLLASGARDGVVHVWNFFQSSQDPIHTISTRSPIGRVQWRGALVPHHEQLATTSLSESTINIWDINKPFIPIGTLLGRRDASHISDMQWHTKHDSSAILSCSKDGILCYHKIKRAFKQIDVMRSVALDWGPGEKLFCVNDVIDRRPEKEKTVFSVRGVVTTSEAIKPSRNVKIVDCALQSQAQSGASVTDEDDINLVQANFPSRSQSHSHPHTAGKEKDKDKGDDDWLQYLPFQTPKRRVSVRLVEGMSPSASQSAMHSRQKALSVTNTEYSSSTNIPFPFMCTAGPDPTLSPFEYEYCATHYVLGGDNPHAACVANSLVAEHLGLEQLALMWNGLALLCEGVDGDGEVEKEEKEKEKEEKQVNRKHYQGKGHIHTMSTPNEQPMPIPGALIHPFEQISGFNRLNQPELDAFLSGDDGLQPIVSLPECLPPPPRSGTGNTIAYIEGAGIRGQRPMIGPKAKAEGGERDYGVRYSNVQGQGVGVEACACACSCGCNCALGEGCKCGCGCGTTVWNAGQDVQGETHGAAASYVPSTTASASASASAFPSHSRVILQLDECVDGRQHTQTKTLHPPPPPPPRAPPVTRTGAQTSVKTTDTINININSTLRLPIGPAVYELLIQLADDGDAQTFSTVLNVMAPFLNNRNNAQDNVDVDELSQKRKLEAVLGYLDILRKLGLQEVATEYIRTSSEDRIASLSHRSTHCFLRCAQCHRNVAPGDTKCSNKRCGAHIAWCVICENPVRGSFVFCHGCGHGGCAKHMWEWYNSQPKSSRYIRCPACGHYCKNK